MTAKTFNRSARKTQQDKDSDLLYFVILANETQAQIEQIESSSRALAAKNAEIQDVKEKYANVIRELYGIEDERDVEKIAEAFRDIDAEVDREILPWLNGTAEEEKTRRKEEYLQAQYGDVIKKHRKSFETQEVELKDENGNPVIDSRTGVVKTEKQYVNVKGLDASTTNSANFQKVKSVLADASRVAGVSVELMHGMWGIESRFGANQGLPNKTYNGNWQLGMAAWRDVLNNREYKGKIMEALNAQGRGDLAARFSSGEDLRLDPIVSTYVAAFYAKLVARQVDVDPNDPKYFGAVYGAYNFGAGRIKQFVHQLADTPDAINNVVGKANRLNIQAHKDANPIFFEGASTGMDIINRYTAVVDKYRYQYKKTFEGGAAPGTSPNVNAFSNAVDNTAPAARQETQPNTETAKQFKSAVTNVTPPQPPVPAPQVAATGGLYGAFTSAKAGLSTAYTNFTTGLSNLWYGPSNG